MRGYSLLEVLIATTIVFVGVAALAQLVALAAHTNRHARQLTMAAALAEEKMEELLPEASAGITASPADALGHNVEGYSDFADASGHLLGGGPAPPAASAYLRRWSMDPLPDSHHNTWILQVLVADLHHRAVARITLATAGKTF
jgi:type II secretory pathway pseudopilin PulG